MKKKLMNAAMFGVFAKFLGKEKLGADASGKVDLSAEEQEKLTAQFGAKVVEMLMTPSAAGDDGSGDSTKLFEAAVEHVASTKVPPALAEAQKQIKELQGTIETLAALPEPLPATTAVGAATGIIGGFKANMALTHNRAAAAYLNSGVMAADPGDTIEVADLRKELGVYLSQGNNLEILRKLYNSFTTAKFLRWIPAVTEYKAVMAEAMTHVVQQFKADWSPKGRTNFVPLTIRNFRHKVDFKIIPSDVGESWLFHLYDESKTVDQMPLTRYIVENILLPKIADDIEMVMIGKAKYVEGSEKTEETMNGIETQLVEAKRSLDKGINFWKKNVNLLEIEDEQVVDEIDAYVAAIAPLYKATKMPVFMSGDVYLKYKRGYKKRWGAGSGTEKVQFGEDRVDFSNCYLQVLDCLHGSPIVFSTPPTNFIGLRHKNPTNFIQDIQRHDREVRIYMEFWLAVGFLIGEAVWAIVPDDYDPQAAITSTSKGSPDKWITTPVVPAAGGNTGDDGETA